MMSGGTGTAVNRFQRRDRRDAEKNKSFKSFAFALLGVLCVSAVSAFEAVNSVSAAEAPPRAAVKYRAELTRIAHAEWGLDAPVAVFAAQIHQESGWNPDAVSRVGAQGMAQFMPATAAWWCGLKGVKNCAPNNPTWAMRALVGYDRWLWHRLPAVATNERLAMTLAAYNGGLGWVQRDRALAVQSGCAGVAWFGDIERHNAGRSADNFAENRAYPRRILLTLRPRYAAWGGV
jgi:soluble lytic murein transglycosylase-like protein